MSRNIGNGSRTRNLHHANLANRKGAIRNLNAKFKLEAKKSNSSNKEGKRAPDITPRDGREMGDTVIRAGPPRWGTIQQVVEVAPAELRFTIPSSPTNAELIAQQMRRTHVRKSLVLHEMIHGPKDVSSDTDSSQHEIEILDD